MDETSTIHFEVPDHMVADVGLDFGTAGCDSPWLQTYGKRRKLVLDEVKDILRQEPVLFAHLMNGTSPFGNDFPLASGWSQDGDRLARHIMHGLNALQEDENGLTLVIACAGAYQQGNMDHLMIWNISVAGRVARLQTGNQENIGGKHYPTRLVDTVALWQQYDPSGAKNSNAPGVPVDTFVKTPVGISVAHHGLFINLFPSSASQDFEAALDRLSREEAGHRFGFFDGQKSCFTTARDLLGAIRTKGPHGTDVDWGARQPQPVVPEIFNKLSLLTNYDRPIGIETMCGKAWDLHDKETRRKVSRDKTMFAALSARLGSWISKKPGAYRIHIRPALPPLL
ncbi:hypothetical protein [Noviherbaspirillum autotrophicum]|uniref:Uncharacterized protein n=1 Tax=Noviherbaspirillum autotrophicum TaxID=709839 RepID=A0A0C2BT99_9BURK|nr:hypothetical protein [Noviherbaspirillum autotrophicum]KIF83269.1 hypothetical protein TSA66_24465 [Noviherbaspirillum autotrophicum]